MYSDTVTLSGAYQDDVVSNWKLVGSGLMCIIIVSRNKQSEVVQLYEVKDKWKLAGSRSSRIINQIEIQTK